MSFYPKAFDSAKAICGSLDGTLGPLGTRKFLQARTTYKGELFVWKALVAAAFKECDGEPFDSFVLSCKMVSWLSRNLPQGTEPDSFTDLAATVRANDPGPPDIDGFVAEPFESTSPTSSAVGMPNEEFQDAQESPDLTAAPPPAAGAGNLVPQGTEPDVSTGLAGDGPGQPDLDGSVAETFEATEATPGNVSSPRQEVKDMVASPESKSAPALAAVADNCLQPNERPANVPTEVELEVEEECEPLENKLLTAVMHCDAAAGAKDLESLLSENKVDLEEPSAYFQQTLLHVAAMVGNLEALEILIKRGANVNARDEGHSTPLHFAACYQDQNGQEGVAFKMVELLLKKGADKEPKDRDNTTPVQLAEESNSIASVISVLKV